MDIMVYCGLLGVAEDWPSPKGLFSKLDVQPSMFGIRREMPGVRRRIEAEMQAQ
jgi:hypothetical protein